MSTLAVLRDSAQPQINHSINYNTWNWIGNSVNSGNWAGLLSESGISIRFSKMVHVPISANNDEL